MSIIPQYPTHGSPISAKWGQDIFNQLRKSQVTNGTQSSGGTIIGKPPKKRRRRAIAPVPLLPFAIYQFEPTPSVPTTDWRNVRIKAGTITDLHPTAGGGGVGDDSQTGAKDILVPANSTLYKIWIECDINQQIVTPPFGVPTARTIKHGSSGWTNYPNQPDSPVDGSGNYTGAPPAKLYVLIGEVSTGVDSPTTDPNYQKLTIVQNLTGSVYALAVMGGRLCNSANGIVDILRMACWRI